MYISISRATDQSNTTQVCIQSLGRQKLLLKPEMKTTKQPSLHLTSLTAASLPPGATSHRLTSHIFTFVAPSSMSFLPALWQNDLVAESQQTHPSRPAKRAHQVVQSVCIYALDLSHYAIYAVWHIPSVQHSVCNFIMK